MSELLLSPLSLSILLGLALWLGWRRLPFAIRVTGVLAWVLLLALCAPVGANALVAWVEADAGPVPGCDAPRDAPILVLSGGLERRPYSADDYAALAPESWRRLQAGIAFWRRQGEPRLVLVGGGPYPIKEAEVMASLARAWGVPAARIDTEALSLTTWENASQLAALGPVPGLGGDEPAWLVSSPLHLPRAMTAFRAAGIKVCPHPGESDYVGPGGVGYFIPQASAIAKSRRAIHELVGQGVYRYRGRP
ncbi:YdcF family protein [Marilutibacter spongiae]|uniref:YdcF family protein n=1 Tax=Marilutibacter spongiae TaxID=2025720 RepID=A0A7W3TLM4_9GAMM|nr:YdcF family protein [Lysobacter spongiae]MBB1060607.1 YdcF family protein [Lysobacter spongiae]